MSGPNDLQFQEFDEAAELLSADPGASTLSMSASPITPGVQDVRLDLSDNEEGQEESSELLGGQKPTGSFWTFEYYQSFFDVDTVQVLDRVKGSMMPLPGRNFVKHHLRNNPDLYVAIGGNLSTFLSERGNPSYHYRPQFHRVSIAAVVIFLYAWLVPVCLWGFLTWRQGAERQIGGYSFLETMCVYGYSLFIYIPTSVLWIIPFEWLHWTLIVIAILISGSVLVLTFWPVVRDDTKVVAMATLATIVLLHTLLAIGCKVAVLLPDSSRHIGTGSHIPPSSHNIDDQTPLTTGRAYIQGSPH
ncbi:Protein YIPF2 YIP1 family member 2 [Takifugu flavidus]|uniref:Protein YIPF n=1 Tax=Takifugu flavidus TaxID=433684 RepID=A0A5C6NS62_9TELE|nr:Protein YIPF2 YIP1 family member 2 [Takifugu flavidus]